MQLQITVMPPNVTEAVVADEECEKAEFCPICSVQQLILKIFVRGLCEQSIFNTVYMYNIDDSGELIYMGETTSTIVYERLSQRWIWYDRMNNRSFATSSSPLASLLIGVHKVDFSQVVDDKCQEGATYTQIH